MIEHAIRLIPPMMLMFGYVATMTAVTGYFDVCRRRNLLLTLGLLMIVGAIPTSILIEGVIDT